ncbi:MAG: hypothetical protein H6Q82_893 [Deltaproteobacteria bacterium]|nr:hypothetical protein [Deltaproteobacteria bacterium]MBP2683186.1 hypothetical protein [Deltaproteobacteria bacterium]
MKTIFAAALIVAVGITGISLWHTARTRHIDSSSSQIFIHGTPVCVVQRAGEILASVGMCGTSGGAPREEGHGNGRVFRGEAPSRLEALPGLPPGHPPVDSIPNFGEGPRILI